jgi:hypothetical protein
MKEYVTNEQMQEFYMNLTTMIQKGKHTKSFL